MRWPGITVIAALFLGAGFGLGRITATVAPVPEQWEIKSVQNVTLKVDKRTGQTWRLWNNAWQPMN